MTMASVTPIDSATKRCSKCGKQKSRTLFYACAKNGLQSRCKDCDNGRGPARNAEVKADRASGQRIVRALTGLPELPDVDLEETLGLREYGADVFRSVHAYDVATRGNANQFQMHSWPQERQDEIDRWANEVMAELRAGKQLRDAIDLANRDEQDLGDQDPPVSLHLGRDPQRAAWLEAMREPAAAPRSLSAIFEGAATVPANEPAPVAEEHVMAERMQKGERQERIRKILAQGGSLTVRQIASHFGDDEDEVSRTHMAMVKLRDKGALESVPIAGTAARLWRLTDAEISRVQSIEDVAAKHVGPSIIDRKPSSSPLPQDNVTCEHYALDLDKPSPNPNGLVPIEPAPPPRASSPAAVITPLVAAKRPGVGAPWEAHLDVTIPGAPSVPGLHGDFIDQLLRQRAALLTKVAGRVAAIDNTIRTFIEEA